MATFKRNPSVIPKVANKITWLCPHKAVEPYWQTPTLASSDSATLILIEVANSACPHCVALPACLVMAKTSQCAVQTLPIICYKTV